MIDKILLSIFQRSFKSITDEMSISLTKTTRSPILCEAKDFVTGLYDSQGQMLEQTENLPILSFSLGPVCKKIIEFYGGEIYPGDVIIHNDVFSMGNQNNDVAIFKPIFQNDRLIGWAAAKGHQAAQVQHVADESPAAVAFPGQEGKFNPADTATVLTLDPKGLEFEKRRLPTNRKQTDGPDFIAETDNPPAAAAGTAKQPIFDYSAVNSLAVDEIGSLNLDLANTKTVKEQ